MTNYKFENSDKLLMNSHVGIHFVNHEGIITYCNERELEILGYSRDEYIGKHYSEFQLESDVVGCMICDLNEKKAIKNLPLKVKGKEKTVYMLYNSSGYFEGEEFIHTRCFATDIEYEAYEVFKRMSPYHIKAE